MVFARCKEGKKKIPGTTLACPCSCLTWNKTKRQKNRDLNERLKDRWIIVENIVKIRNTWDESPGQREALCMWDTGLVWRYRSDSRTGISRATSTTFAILYFVLSVLYFVSQPAWAGYRRKQLMYIFRRIVLGKAETKTTRRSNAQSNTMALPTKLNLPKKTRYLDTDDFGG